MAKITTTYKGDMLFETKIGDHTLTIDVPESMGGSDRGPMPPQLFIASLGSCVGAFVASYCREHNIEDKDLKVDVSFEKAANPVRLTDIKIRVELPNAECGNREAAIQRVAAHCPVHETISTLQGIEFEILDKTDLQPA